MNPESLGQAPVAAPPEVAQTALDGAEVVVNAESTDQTQRANLTAARASQTRPAFNA